MGYIKVKYRRMLEEIDCRYNYNIPYNWNDFVDKVAVKHHNLIIKKPKNKCICTNCKHEFTTTKKAKEYEKCPNCKNTYMIKMYNLKHYIFEDVAVLVDKVDSQLILRLFEIRSKYDNINRYYGFKVSSAEYARVIPFEQDCTFVNDRTSKNQGYVHVYHISNPGKWRQYSRYYGLSTKGYIYPNNLQQIFQDTEYKYSMIWELAKKMEYFDIQDVMRNAKNSNKVEMLVKAQLYNLALEAGRFYGEGSFENIFGVSKTFYPFMKKYNITYNQLEILQLLKETNIKKIRYLEKFKIDRLEEICMYININRFIRYAKLHRGKVDTYLYKDYLKFASVLGYDLKSNKYAFPKELRKEHDKLAIQYKIHNKELLDKAISRRYKKLEKNVFKNKKFIITPAPTIAALEDESKQQHNCVRTYAEDYASGICDIYFMRDIKAQDKSLVTVEVKDNKVVQSRIKYNDSPNKTQIQFLDNWERKVLKGAA